MKKKPAMSLVPTAELNRLKRALADANATISELKSANAQLTKSQLNIKSSEEGGHEVFLKGAEPTSDCGCS